MSMKIAIATAAALAIFGGPALAASHAHHRSKAHAGPYGEMTGPRSSAYGAGFDSSARAAFGRSYDFEAWPTDYLINRFGDHQAQGR